MPSLYYDHSIDDEAFRQTARVWRRALRQTLLTRPVTDSTFMSAEHPLAETLFHAVEAHAPTLPVDHPIRRGWEDISEWILAHPDSDGFRDFLDVTDAWMLQLFRDAMAEEAAA